jgi:hypothetical protein
MVEVRAGAPSQDVVMGLPFSRDQFLDVFATYNRLLWPAASILWLASLAGVVQLIRGRAHGVGLSALLAVHWAWSAVAYHAFLFVDINPAAWGFAGLFMAQAAALAWTGVIDRRLRFDWARTPRHVLAGVLLVFALAYPAVAIAAGHPWPRTPTFGVPCPTALVTAGLLLAAVRPVPRWLMIVPVLWSVVGGSAALLLGVVPDLMLFAAGGALVAFAVAPGLLERRSAP